MKRASFLFFFFLLSCGPSILMLVAASDTCVEVASNDRYIVYVGGPSNGEDLETFSINILVSVLGSEKAAKKALVHLYKHVTTGFAATLNPKQACAITSVPGVLQVIPDRFIDEDLPVKKLFKEQLKPHLHTKPQL